MTDNEIIKALEQCYLAECVGCPYAKGCITELAHDAKDLINRLKAENEEMEEIIEEYSNAVKELIGR